MHFKVPPQTCFKALCSDWYFVLTCFSPPQTEWKELEAHLFSTMEGSPGAIWGSSRCPRLLWDAAGEIQGSNHQPSNYKPNSTTPPEPQRLHKQKKGHFAQIQSSKVKDIKKIRKNTFFHRVKLCRKFSLQRINKLLSLSHLKLFLTAL